MWVCVEPIADLLLTQRTVVPSNQLPVPDFNSAQMLMMLPTVICHQKMWIIFQLKRLQLALIKFWNNCTWKDDGILEFMRNNDKGSVRLTCSTKWKMFNIRHHVKIEEYTKWRNLLWSLESGTSFDYWISLSLIKGSTLL